MKVARILASVFVLMTASAAASAQCGSDNPALDQSRKLLEAGLLDQAEVFVKQAAEQAEQAGRKCDAAMDLMQLSYIYNELGEDVNFLNTLIELQGQAQGTELDAMASAWFRLGFAEVSMRPYRREQLKPLETLAILFDAETSLAGITSEDERNSMLSQELNLRTELYMITYGIAGKAVSESSAKDLPAGLQIFLASALRNVPPDKFDPNPTARSTSLPRDVLTWLDARRPWDKALMQSALSLNDKVATLDAQRFRRPEQAKYLAPETAKDKSQRGDIYAAFGDLPAALPLKRAALATFDAADLFDDAVKVLDDIANISAEIDTPQSRADALAASGEAVNRIERQTQGLVGQTLSHFLAKHQSSYIRHFILLVADYGAHQSASDTASIPALQRLLLQADRMNFRSTRRDMAVYVELGNSIESNPGIEQQIAKQKQTIDEAKRIRDEAQTQGKSPDYFCPGQGICNGSPYLDLMEKKLGLVTMLEDMKRKGVGSTRAVSKLPSSVDEVTSGMTDSDGIVMYISPPGSDELAAAVLAGGKPPRLVMLPGVNAGKLKELVRKPLSDSIDELSPEAWNHLSEISKDIWQPLYPLPENLTVVLTPDLLGIPFEALPDSTGQPTINHHQVRYAFGLSPRLGMRIKLPSPTKALVAGAERFSSSTLDQLTASGEEIGDIQNILRSRNISFSPEDGLPRAGTALFMRSAAFDFIHISTHSRVDLGAPMFDTLLFPDEELPAYMVGLSHVRANLLVLSSCELFRARDSSDNPVSGITTAAMARIAPQVVSTLWSVDAAATRIFMLRFYDALLKEGDPSVALAITKKDFINPARLELWLKAAGKAVPDDIQNYREPYYWAPFVLTIDPK